MSDETTEVEQQPRLRSVTLVSLFWAGYLALTLLVGFATSMTIHSEAWQLIAWGFVSSAALLVLSRFMTSRKPSAPKSFPSTHETSTLARFGVGLLLGLGAFGLHTAIVTHFGGPIEFERVPEVGVAVAALYGLRFLATSCMEEIGFRGFALRRLSEGIGVWPALAITTVAFGLSHLAYGWDLRTIALGVLPGGLVWGMSAIATHGLAVPIALHAAWNFASWTAGNRAETGLWRMVITGEALDSSRVVGTVSYLVTCGGLTALFWLVHRRNVRLAESPRPA